MLPSALLLILLLRIHSTLAADVFRVTGPEAPIVAMVGGVAVLECQLIPEKPAEDMEVQWVRGDSKFHSPIHLYRFGQDVVENQDQAYRGRTELFKDEFNQGNVSLKLKDVRLDDEGDYLCMVEYRKIIEQAPVQLKVASFGLQPAIRLDGYRKEGIGIECQSSGWYPAPMMHWASGDGKDMTAEAQTEAVRNTDGFYRVSSALEATSQPTNIFKCLIRSTILKHSEESSLHIPDEFFPRMSGFFTAFILFLLLLLGLLAAAAYFIVKKRRIIKELRKCPTKNEHATLFNKQEVLKIEVDNANANLLLEKQLSKSAVERVIADAVSVTFDPETANPYLAISEDQMTISFNEDWREFPECAKRFNARLFVAATEGYGSGSGSQYWEVNVGSKPDWDLGVVRESVSRNDWAVLSPESGYWTIGKRGESYEVNEETPKPIEGKATAQIIGIHLHYDGGTVAFYNVDSMAHIHTFTTTFTEKIYPFFSPWGSSEVMKISPL